MTMEHEEPARPACRCGDAACPQGQSEKPDMDAKADAAGPVLTRLDLIVADILTAAADLIEKPGAWTQGQCARGEDGSCWPCPEDDDATCWCGVGAVMRVAYFSHGQSSPAECEAIERLHAFAKERGMSAFAMFNDAPDRTQAEVVAALRTAAAEKARTANSVGMSRQANPPIPPVKTGAG